MRPKQLKEDAAIQAVFKEWISNPTNPYRLKYLVKAMVEWEIKARMQKLAP